jgi:2-oxoglutarate dehydrogenase E2 component (dihydrolipoamide succinyltransferase)
MTATLDIHAPPDQTEGTRSQVLRWLKAIGEPVTEHEPLIEIETDKVTVEVAAPATGVLREILKPEQEEIAPGDILGRIETVGRVETDEAALGVEAHAGADVAAAAHANDAHDHDNVEQGRPPGTGAFARSEPKTITTGTPLRLSPAVRRLVAERGLDPSTIHGTGEGGRITIDDVLAHSSSPGAVLESTRPAAADTLGSARTARTPTSPTPPAPAPDAATNTRTIPHSPVRKRIADHMVQSLLHTAPHVTTVFEADMTAVMTHRANHRAIFEQRGAPLTFTAYFLAATVNAIRAVPEANSRWTDTALEIHEDIHIGVATAIEGVGLVVPVLRNVEALDLFGIAQGLNRLVTAARENKLTPADVRGGTFTISNHGVSGSLLATPIVINQPQSAILGVGKLEKRPVVVESGAEERIVIRPQCYVTLTIDHRVMDGHQANRFLQTFVRTLEEWPAK